MLRNLLAVIVASMAVAGLPDVASSQQNAGAIYGLYEANLPVCDDGIATSFTREDVDATTDDEIEEFANTRQACGRNPLTSAQLSAQCSPPVTSTGSDKRIVTCLAIVALPSIGRMVEVNTDDFKIISIDGEFTATDSYDDQIGQEFLWTGGRRVYPDEVAAGFLILEGESSFEPGEAVLLWKESAEGEPGTGDDTPRAILLETLDAGLAQQFDLHLEEDSPTPAPSEGQSFTGTSDKVIGPFELDEGIYRVTARYSGDSNFIVEAMTGDSDYPDLLFNEIGNYSGEATLRLTTDTEVILDVSGIGNWTIVIEPLM